MSDEGQTWPEQDAVLLWLEEHGIEVSVIAGHELAGMVTAPRLKIQQKVLGLERRIQELETELRAWRDGERTVDLRPVHGGGE